MSESIDGRLAIVAGLSGTVFLQIVFAFYGALAGANVMPILSMTFPASLALWAIVLGFYMAAS